MPDSASHGRDARFVARKPGEILARSCKFSSFMQSGSGCGPHSARARHCRAWTGQSLQAPRRNGCRGSDPATRVCPGARVPRIGTADARGYTLIVRALGRCGANRARSDRQFPSACIRVHPRFHFLVWTFRASRTPIRAVPRTAVIAWAAGARTRKKMEPQMWTAPHR